MIEIAALVPMKGHSERVKNKNMREFNGKPLMHYILNTLERVPNITNIYIDTDSKEIATEAKCISNKIIIIERPEKLRGDFVSMNDIIQYDINCIQQEHFIQTHATNPLLKTETVEKAAAMYEERLKEFDSIFSVNRIQSRLYDEKKQPLNHNPRKLIRTQDLFPIYEENSNFYIFSRQSFKKSGARIGMNPQVFEMNPLESIDIDEETDFVLAEILQEAIFK